MLTSVLLETRLSETNRYDPFTTTSVPRSVLLEASLLGPARYLCFRHLILRLVLLNSRLVSRDDSEYLSVVVVSSTTLVPSRGPLYFYFLSSCGRSSTMVKIALWGDVELLTEQRVVRPVILTLWNGLESCNMSSTSERSAKDVMLHL